MSASAGLGLLLGCHTSIDPPTRPPNVPTGAFWLGGNDGGVFVELIKLPEDPADMYRGAVYYEQSGETWFIGKFRLEPSGHARIDLTNPHLFDSWDGNTLHLADGSKLKPLATVR